MVEIRQIKHRVYWDSKGFYYFLKKGGKLIKTYIPKKNLVPTLLAAKPQTKAEPRVRKGRVRGLARASPRQQKNAFAEVVLESFLKQQKNFQEQLEKVNKEREDLMAVLKEKQEQYLREGNSDKAERYGALYNKA